LPQYDFELTEFKIKKEDEKAKDDNYDVQGGMSAAKVDDNQGEIPF